MPTKTPLEPLPQNAEWQARCGAVLVTRYKGCDIHRSSTSIAMYVNGLYVGTSLKRAKEYINNTIG